MVASVGKEHLKSVIKIAGVPDGVLRTAAIYGANASGKSSLFEGFRFFVGAVRDSQRSWKPDGPVPIRQFALGEHKSEVSEFQLDFLIDKIRYRYGFSTSSTQILRESLYCYPNGRRQIWFERDVNSEGQSKFGKHLLGENRAIESLTRKNSLFLSAAAQNNHEMLLPVFSWITSNIEFLFEGRTRIDTDLARQLQNDDLRERVARLLSHADLGIVGMEVRKQVVDDKLVGIMDEMFKKLAALSQSGPVEIHPPREFHQVLLQHRTKSGSRVTMENQFESAGTLAFLSLLCPTLEKIDSGGVLCVDELDASLHPLLALEIVRLFHDPQTNVRGAQLIFNTHDVNLLDSTVLRRDEIWFTEKDVEGATHLYSLGDFMPRKDENLKRGYLEGRYGGVPYLGFMDFKAPEG